MNSSIASTAMTQEWLQQISLLGTFLEHEPMARHTTLAVGGAARWFFRPTDRTAAIEAMRLCPSDVRILPLGRGSNMLIQDTGYDGLVIDLSDLNSTEFNGFTVRAEAGGRMSRLARQCADHGLSGCEFMATVPGDIGGGVAMNAGCFAQQVSDSLIEIEVLLPNGDVQSIKAEALHFSYRHTDLPAGSIVLSASFTLHPDSPEQIRERMRSMRSRRSATQPLAQPNCGSVFKNPDGDHAARLIEATGLKGFSIGGARISEKHANFIVNEGDASSADILALIERAQLLVKEQTGIELEPEVRMIRDSETGGQI
ncbi:UDP-N-acetylmuramate dehydrogenase [Mariprofundus sp. EBB-1]|uniref:UDP-N-acetylmuramate dehydrogenase n=1 Tax=Mariprofundus sp. EBB-1 TaxID=2650971 RepID=UPI000EF18E25|nr:UDP-N-acetylmuramate dehydrogenase [Mariprofundus sp. EBB-1]RLL54987.1 UDP-N-acetylmuramate dehydrogenase [Mariprofundus sp. EBB-1]